MYSYIAGTLTSTKKLNRRCFRPKVILKKLPSNINLELSNLISDLHRNYNASAVNCFVVKHPRYAERLYQSV